MLFRRWCVVPDVVAVAKLATTSCVAAQGVVVSPLIRRKVAVSFLFSFLRNLLPPAHLLCSPSPLQ